MIRYVTSQVRDVSGSTVVNSNRITHSGSDVLLVYFPFVYCITAAYNLEPCAITTMESEGDKPLLQLETMIGFGGKEFIAKSVLKYGKWQRYIAP